MNDYEISYRKYKEGYKVWAVAKSDPSKIICVRIAKSKEEALSIIVDALKSGEYDRICERDRLISKIKNCEQENAKLQSRLRLIESIIDPVRKLINIVNLGTLSSEEVKHVITSSYAITAYDKIRK